MEDLDAVAQAGAAQLQAEDTGVPAAADVSTFDHAWTLVESLRIGAGVLGAFGVRP